MKRHFISTLVYVQLTHSQYIAKKNASSSVITVQHIRKFTLNYSRDSVAGFNFHFQQLLVPCNSSTKEILCSDGQHHIYHKSLFYGTIFFVIFFQPHFFL